MLDWSLERDVEFVVDSVGETWTSFKDAKIFITGGTGFIGCWLLESLLVANQRLNLGVRVTVLTRNIEAFRSKAHHLAEYSAFSFVSGNVQDFESPVGDFTHVIHAATDASADLNENNPKQMFDTIIQGTRRVLDFAQEKKVARVLFLSSGAIYGQQPWELENVPEESTTAPSCNDPKAAYAEGKRAAEMMCAIYAKQFKIEIVIARIFSLLGPYLELGVHFAAGNFIRDAMAGKTVVVNGNGLPCRSYLYASDLTIWLWNMLAHAKSGKPYNVGSDESVSIKLLAERVSKIVGNGDFKILGASDQGWNLGRYVPSTKLIQHDLRLKRTVSLDDAILRTALWHGWKK